MGTKNKVHEAITKFLYTWSPRDPRRAACFKIELKLLMHTIQEDAVRIQKIIEHGTEQRATRQEGIKKGDTDTMTQWEDISRDLDGSIQEIRHGPLRITIVQKHLRNPDFWTVHCAALQMDTVDTKLPSSQDAELAKNIAINMVRNKLKEMSVSLGCVTKEK